MFKDNKLRLLMTLVGFTRLGANEDPDASWVIPSSLTSAELQEAIDLIRKFEFAPPTYEDGKGPEDMLRSKAAAARKPARRVDWDDDDDGIDNDEIGDRGEYALDDPTSRQADGPRKKVLKRRQRARTPVELDDEEKEARADARRQKELQKQLNVKSTMFVHDSDDESDAEADALFFAREAAQREENRQRNAKAHILGSLEPASKKRKADDESGSETSKRRKSPARRKAGPFDSDESDEDMANDDDISSRAPSEELEDDANGSEEEATDTPLSSQLAGAIDVPTKTRLSASTTSKDVSMGDDDSDDEDEVVVVRRPAARNMRGGFVVDSDSE